MNIQSIILTFVLTLFSSVALAGAGHDHGAPREPVTQQQAEQTANQILATFVGKGVIDKSWDTSKVEKAERKQFDSNLEWVVSYKNESISDPQKRTLYIFMTLAGEYLAANYTGE